jgi:hypothetical protein
MKLWRFYNEGDLYCDLQYNTCSLESINIFVDRYQRFRGSYCLIISVKIVP